MFKIKPGDVCRINDNVIKFTFPNSAHTLKYSIPIDQTGHTMQEWVLNHPVSTAPKN